MQEPASPPYKADMELRRVYFFAVRAVPSECDARHFLPPSPATGCDARFGAASSGSNAEAIARVSLRMESRDAAGLPSPALLVRI